MFENIKHLNHFFSNLVKNGVVNKFFASGAGSSVRRVGDRFPLPRRGDPGKVIDSAVSALGVRAPDRKVMRAFVLSPKTLRRLSETDPITWSIKRTRRDQIAHSRWDIVPKLDNFSLEIDKWQESLFDNLNPWGYITDINLKYIPEDIYHQNISDIRNIFMSPTDKYDKKMRIKWIMQKIIRQVKDRSLRHATEIRKILSRPCNEYPSFGGLNEIIMDDTIVFDTAGLALNNDKLNRLAEMYPIPGDEIFLYRNDDRTIPEPPEYSYLWEEAGSKVAEFTRDELIYFVCNPQHNGYGRSPVEVSSYIITASLFADSYNMDYFKYSDVPPGLLNLGENINDDQRMAFKAAWEAEKAGKGGIFKMFFISGTKGVEFVPLRQYSQKDIQMYEYLKWSLSIKCACHQISPQDIGFTMDLHRTTSEVQLQISNDRGIRVLLEKYAEIYNGELIKKKFPAFGDVEFKFLDIGAVDEITRNNLAIQNYEAGVITLNQARERINEKPIPGGDMLLVNRIPGQGFMPADMLEKQAEQIGAQLEADQSNAEDVPPDSPDPGGGVSGEQQAAQQEENVPKEEQKPEEVVVEQNKEGMNKLQKVIDGLNGKKIIIKFNKYGDSFDFGREAYGGVGGDLYGSRRFRFGGLRGFGGLDDEEDRYKDPNLSPEQKKKEAILSGIRAGATSYDSAGDIVADLASTDPNRRVKGLARTIGIASAGAGAVGMGAFTRTGRVIIGGAGRVVKPFAQRGALRTVLSVTSPRSPVRGIFNTKPAAIIIRSFAKPSSKIARMSIANLARSGANIIYRLARKKLGALK